MPRAGRRVLPRVGALVDNLLEMTRLEAGGVVIRKEWQPLEGVLGAALKRLDKAGVKPVAKGPVPLPAGLPQGVFLTVVQDPDGNLVELVGPKK